jgi:hypothetical protein
VADDPTIDIPICSGGGSEVEPNNLQVCMTALGNEAAAASSRRTNRADQLAGDSSAMWSVYLTSPNAMTGIGFRTLQQSGGYPADTGTGTGGK